MMLLHLLNAIELGLPTEFITRASRKSTTCLYCARDATVSCFVEEAEMFLQLTCEPHIPETATIMWRKEEIV